MANTSKRIDGIDFWRGFALVSIFINHLPENVFQYVTHKNFGFSDAAELFVFLSGVSVAIAYGTRFFEGQTGAAVGALFRRILKLYGVQILIAFASIALFVAAAFVFDEDDLLEDEDRDVVLSHPGRGIAAVLALTHQFDNVNILPLYIVLLAMTPLLWLAGRRDDRLMLLAATGLYLVARLFSLNLPSWPNEGGWFFNPLAWQLIFATGLFVGRRVRGGIPYDARLMTFCLGVLAVSLFVVTDGLSFVPDLWENLRGTLDHGKTDLGMLRLVHFLALGYVAYHSGLTELLRKTFVFAPLCLIGRHSLPVFATGSILAAVGEVIVETRSEGFNHEVMLGIAIVGAGIVLHYLVARGFAAWAVAQRRHAIAGPVVARP